MSVQTQIDRLNAIKERMRTNLVAQGVTVPEDTMLEAMAEQVLSVAGEDGVGISSVEQTTTSTADDGSNIITVTLTDGTTSTFTIQNGSRGSAGAETVPDYVQEEAERVAKAVALLQNGDTLTFIACSDIHIDSSYAQSSESAKHMGQAMGIIRKMVPIDFAACLGDISVGHSATTFDEGRTEIIEANVAIYDGFLGIPNLRTMGNHDSMVYSIDVNDDILPYGELYGMIGKYNTGATFPDTDKERGYCYRDFDDAKVRVICINSSDLNGLTDLATNKRDGHYISATQLQWFVNALDMTNKDSWGIVILSHHPIHWYGSMANILTIVDAYAAGSSGSLTVDSTTISYDFNGKNAAKLIGSFHGHTHNLIHGTAGESGIVRMGTPNACFGRNNEYGNTSYGYSEDFAATYGETTTYSKTADSATDTAFCVYTIDLANEVIYSTCYGAGYDREISFDGSTSTTYSVRYDLTNVTAKFDTSKVEEGASYTNDLTAADGYELDSVTVTMGGVDITNEAYTDCVISISNVTGNIVITATATATGGDAGGYTNIIDTIGYSDNYRLSTSTGELRAQDSYVTTGFIDTRLYTKPLIIRTKGVDFRTSEHGYSAYVQYSADETFFSSGYLNVIENDSVIIAFDDDGNLTFTINSVTDTNPLFRLCGSGRGANLIVTVNEEITDNESTGDYTNLVPTSIDTNGSVYNDTGYMTDYRLNSSGTTSALSGAIHSGFIPYNGEVIRVYGNPADNMANTGNYIAFYDSSFTKVGVTAFNSYDENDITWSVQNGLYLFTVDPNNVTTSWIVGCMTSAAYIRASLSSYSDASDFVVTLDEEIV